MHPRYDRVTPSEYKRIRNRGNANISCECKTGQPQHDLCNVVMRMQTQEKRVAAARRGRKIYISHAYSGLQCCKTSEAATSGLFGPMLWGQVFKLNDVACKTYYTVKYFNGQVSYFVVYAYIRTTIWITLLLLFHLQTQGPRAKRGPPSLFFFHRLFIIKSMLLIFFLTW